jgi:hypothetical protein
MSDIAHTTDVAIDMIIVKVLVNLIMSVVDFELDRPPLYLYRIRV